MDIKIILGIISAIVGGVAYFPYIKDIFAKKTKPHAYTWLIWFITQSVAVIGILYGGGNWGSLSLLVFTVLVLAVFIFSIKYGTKNITKGDTFVLILALVAILIWWQLDKPILSIIIITAIDVIGYIPSIRKTFIDPWSETSLTWLLFSISNLISILALNEYNFLTTTYLFFIMIANAIMFSVAHFRRDYVQK